MTTAPRDPRKDPQPGDRDAAVCSLFAEHDRINTIYPGYPVAWSQCKNYRYTLWRVWDETKLYCQFIGLNPSTADETLDDPTIRRCIRFAKDWGYGALCMTNLFAYRATEPKDMKSQSDPVGFVNNHWLHRIAQGAGVVVAAWGTHGSHMGRDVAVKALLKQTALCCLKLTSGGHPSHPLYLKADCVPLSFTIASGDNR